MWRCGSDQAFFNKNNNSKNNYVFKKVRKFLIIEFIFNKNNNSKDNYVFKKVREILIIEINLD